MSDESSHSTTNSSAKHENRNSNDITYQTLTAENTRLRNRLNNKNARLKEYEIEVIDYAEKIKTLSRGQRQTKRQIRMDNEWNGEDAKISDKVTHWIKTYLFPRYKFLKNGWMEYREDETSLSSFVRIQLKMEEFSDHNYMDLWNRVISNTINSKYTSIRSNLNNEIRKAYKSKSLILIFLCVELN